MTFLAIPGVGSLGTGLLKATAKAASKEPEPPQRLTAWPCSTSAASQLRGRACPGTWGLLRIDSSVARPPRVRTFRPVS